MDRGRTRRLNRSLPDRGKFARHRARRETPGCLPTAQVAAAFHPAYTNCRRPLHLDWGRAPRRPAIRTSHQASSTCQGVTLCRAALTSRPRSRVLPESRAPARRARSLPTRFPLPESNERPGEQQRGCQITNKRSPPRRPPPPPPRWVGFGSAAGGTHLRWVGGGAKCCRDGADSRRPSIVPSEQWRIEPCRRRPREKKLPELLTYFEIEIYLMSLARVKRRGTHSSSRIGDLKCLR